MLASIRNRAALLSLALIALLGSCLTPSYPPQWVGGNVKAKSEEILWQVITHSLDRNGFALGAGVDRGKHQAVTGWKTFVAPFKGEGYRERCYVEYSRSESAAGGFDMRVRVERETNEDIVRPLDLSYADWQPTADNVDKAKIVFGHIRATLGPQFEMRDKEKAAAEPVKN
jgi:hypothetical protein